MKKTGTINDKEYKSATSQQSQITSHILTCKIHKLDFLSEDCHGNGLPILDPNGKGCKLKFRSISPLSNSPSSKMGKMLGKLLEPLQNSGLRLDGITEIVKDIQNSMDSRSLKKDETIISFDCIKMYDNLSLDLVKQCLGTRCHEYEEKTSLPFSIDPILNCIELCYNEGIEYKDRIYKLKRGAPTGHSISSAIQNLVLSTYEQKIYQPLIKTGEIKMYNRWVDDVICRIDNKSITEIMKKLNNFDKSGNLKFTLEKPNMNNNEYSIPFLDILIKWSNTSKYKWSTEVFRKATTSKVMKPFDEFGPTAWKTGTLVWFLRRGVTHSSTMKIMAKEMDFLRNKFATVGYPHWLISQKILKTIAVMLGYEKDPKNGPKEGISQKWRVLQLSYTEVF